MSFGEWFRSFALGNPFVWWVAFIAISALLYPILRQFRLWQSRRRFMESQSARLSNPQNAEVRFQLATLHAEGGSWRRALEQAREAVRVAGENPLYDGGVPYHFLLLLGRTLYHEKRFSESVETLQRALQAKAERGRSEARFVLGQAHYRMGEAQKAIPCYRESIEENPSHLEAYFRVAQAEAALGRPAGVQAAHEEFRQVAAQLPRFAGKHRFRWRVAFLLFPLTRRII
ncbi:MAG TPA: tetratricopeptide repeat protein [Planctomycetota bacterium]|jgi:tetratricopeptide (TPR) repeat protein|nr:tetratricopeptide repeat protein [Planctomycetota bacterium]